MSKEAINKLLNDSSSEQDFRNKVSDLAASKHGKEAVNSLLESSKNEEDFIRKVSDLAESDPIGQDTLESKYLDPTYKTMGIGSKIAGTYGLPASMVVSPVLQTVRGVLREAQKLPSDDIKIFEGFGDPTNKYASTAPLMEDLYSAAGIQQEPISKTVEKVTGYELHPYIKKEFPKASSFLESIRPSDIASIPADIALYGKFGFPAQQEIGRITGRTAKAISPFMPNIIDKQGLALNALKSGSTNTELFNELSASGKIKDVAQRIINDPTLNRIDRTKTLEALGGETVPTYVNRGGQMVLRHRPSGGKIGELTSKQFNLIEDLSKKPETNYYDVMETNIEAKNILANQGLPESVQSAASKKIDEFLPYASDEAHQIELMNKRSELIKQEADVSVAIEAQKASELSKLSKQNLESLSKKESIPFFIENPAYEPGRTEYVTSKEVGPSPEFTPIQQKRGPLGEPIAQFEPSGPVVKPEAPIKEISHKTYIPPQSDELVWNRPGAEKRMEIVKEMESIQNQMDMLQGVNPNHPAVKALVDKRNQLASQYWSIAEEGFPTKEAYHEHLRNLNTKVLREAYEDRISANKQLGDLPRTSEEYGSTQAAAKAVEEATQNVLISSMDDASRAEFMNRQMELSDLLDLKELYKGSYATKSGSPNIPFGGILNPAGIAREAIRLKGKYIDPALLDYVAKPYENVSKAYQGATAGIRDLSATEKAAVQSGALKSDQNQGRSPQSIPTPIQAQAMGRGLVENLADYEIPRNTNNILANKQAVLAKVAQVTDNPQIVSMLDDALTKHPDKLDPVIKTMSMQFPNLFVTDKYNRVDGKIFHPDPMIKQQLIQQAYDAVKNRENLSNTEKAMLWNGLNKDGSLPDSFQ